MIELRTIIGQVRELKKLSEKAVEIINKLYTERPDRQIEYLPLKDCAQAIRELTDKLEYGMPPEPLCEIGDTVYETDGIRVYSSVIKNIIFDTAGIAFDKTAVGKSIFLSKEAADAKLKEFQGK